MKPLAKRLQQIRRINAEMEILEAEKRGIKLALEIIHEFARELGYVPKEKEKPEPKPGLVG